MKRTLLVQWDPRGSGNWPQPVLRLLSANFFPSYGENEEPVFECAVGAEGVVIPPQSRKSYGVVSCFQVPVRCRIKAGCNTGLLSKTLGLTFLLEIRDPYGLDTTQHKFTIFRHVAVTFLRHKMLSMCVGVGSRLAVTGTGSVSERVDGWVVR